MGIEIEKILPLTKVENGTILSAQGDITIGFEVTLPEIFTLSDRDYEAYHQAWVKAIRLLPQGSVFHKQDWFTESSFKADFEKAGKSFLSRSSERFFNERECLEHQCYIYLTQKPKDRKLGSSVYSNLLRKSIVPQQTINPVLFKDFLDSAGQFERILKDSGFVTLSRMNNDDLAGTLEKAGVIERYCFLSTPGTRPVIQDIHIKNELKVGNNHCELYTLADVDDLPALCGSRINYDKYSTDRTKFSIGFASPLGQLLNCNHILNQYVFIEDSQKTIKRLEAKKLRLQSLSGYSRENAISRDAVNDFLNEAIGQQRLPVKAHFNILAWSEDKEKVKDLKNLVSSAMAQMDATAKQETDGAPQIWFAGMPGNEADFPMNETFDTFVEQATCFFNLETNYRNSISPFGIRLGDRLTGKPVHVDISDEPMRLGWTTNRSKFTLGPSGSGKSFWTNHLLRSYYEQGAHIVVMDIGHSYRGLCELAGGYYFTYSEADPIKFNPFHLADGDTLDTEKKESIKTLLLALWKKDDEPYRRSEYVAISNALTGYYKHLDTYPDIFPCFNTFYEYLMEHYLQVLEDGKVKEKDFDVANFLYVLNPYYRGGEFDYLLNATENLDLLHERFIVFEIDACKDHPILFPVVTLIIMEMIISKMRKLPGIRKVVLIEECWKAIAKEGMAEYIRYLYKTMRKFYGEPIVVTQEVEDIISSPVVKQAIINNSDCKILLDQSKYQNKFDAIQELLGLTDKEKAMILSMNKSNDPKRKYKEVFISLGQFSKVYRTEVSLEEYLAYTTEESEKVKVHQYAAKYGSIQKGIAVLAMEMRTKN
ncbi:TraG family conjugative transposon ATPase [Mucilaginibacter rubeus]|uniref:TraG family conjugative transposon ATPase n=1 Tax=Mucilaginibacter rubeus TaxID=2027860 RepID=A0AAE6JCN5_9SPHI|nr:MULTISPECIES: TraG family conjugative transposon ATPase [Mucilaginibacter]QEM03086.1 TraG family conjugative transposon ATPase [Mucilaginibacter rubeus]QEM15705.1 TraG family conjugative transposon ATPase [Mucilaginibacter gossypii]QTE41556.1 TraG family conjugative transposon ATPase [Mucilaginibacter rubeus]QTE48162.1 TraG family conjugative transposon ATPase [Mucilaginibacter rubeus]QTE59553.1 TraG family conjugative transposon ATPase [Mucilaginibacter rubeus]